MHTPKDVLDFWHNAGPTTWWMKDGAFDAEIANRFGDLHSDAAAGKLNHWADTAEGALALVIVLDQFSRNLFRNDPRAFAQDDKALQFTRFAMDKGFDGLLSMEDGTDIGVFIYLPLMHSERLDDQKTCLARMKQTGLEPNIKAAEEHLDIIQRFGRFPHRNHVLGRTMKPEEQAYLDEGGFKG